MSGGETTNRQPKVDGPPVIVTRRHGGNVHVGACLGFDCPCYRDGGTAAVLHMEQCADTPLMRLVLAERDRLRAALAAAVARAERAEALVEQWRARTGNEAIDADVERILSARDGALHRCADELAAALAETGEPT